MRSVLGVHWKVWCWSWNSSTLATWCKELTHLKRDAGAGKDWWEGDDRGWDGWMASPTQWTWVWVNSGSWWWTGRFDVLLSWGHKESDMTELLKWTEHESCLHAYLTSFISCCCFRVFGVVRFWVELITISYSNHICNSVEVCLFIWLKCHDIYY